MREIEIERTARVLKQADPGVAPASRPRSTSDDPHPALIVLLTVIAFAVVIGVIVGLATLPHH
jgi:hypothetical protein